MKILKNLTLTFIAILLFNCSKDDNPTPNGFTFSNDFYPLEFVYAQDNDLVTDDVTALNLTLSSKDIEQSGEITGVNYVNMEYDGESIKSETITNIDNYEITENLTIDGDSYSGGTGILDDNLKRGLTLKKSVLVINSISQTNINLDFTLTREDGKIIKGHFEGAYKYLD